jgi:hypothetical protein
MRARIMALAWVLVAAGAACGPGFDPEGDYFKCASNDDCLDGYVCGGHTLISNSVTSYCVAEEEATVGFYLRAPQATGGVPTLTPPCGFSATNGGAGGTIDYSVWIETSQKTVLQEGYDPSPSRSNLTVTGTCAGAPEQTGAFDLLRGAGAGAGHREIGA